MKETIFEQEQRLKQLAKESVKQHNQFRYISNKQNRVVTIKN